MDATALSGSVPDWLRQRAASTPDRLALVTADASLSFAALDRAADAMTGGLHAAGVARGQLVALLAANSAAYAVAVHALARLGAVLMPLNTRLAPAELAFQLQDAAARHLVADAAHFDVVTELGGELPSVRLHRLEELNGAASGQAAAPRRHASGFDLGEVQTVVYTSGTTGRPKGAQLTYGNHLWSALASALNLGLRDDDRWLACLPLFHVGGLAILLRGVICGTTVVLHETFDPDRVSRAIDEEGVSHVSVVANMLQRLLDGRGERPFPPTLRCVLLGGGPAPRPLLEAGAARSVPVAQTYGLTEAASQVATLSPADALRKLGSAGKPLFGTELRIVRDDGADCAPGEAGDILIRGPTVTPGYLNRPDETAAVLRDGWLLTGDVGHLDAEGYLYVLDRRDDLIVSGGENVYPAEVEAVLASHPAVLEAGVYALPDERWGRAPAAVVVLRADAATTGEELVAFCRERLAGFKVPRRIGFAAALPRNAAGKLLRRELAARHGP